MAFRPELYEPDVRMRGWKGQHRTTAMALMTLYVLTVTWQASIVSELVGGFNWQQCCGTHMPLIIHISFAQPEFLLESLVFSHAVQAEGCEVLLYLDYFLKPGMMEERDRAICTWWARKRHCEPLGRKLECNSNLPMPAYALAVLKPMQISQSIFSCEIVKFESLQGGR